MRKLMHRCISAAVPMVATILATGACGDGATGPAGEPGDPGLPGLPGLPGKPGLQGPQGSSAETGKVSSVELIVSPLRATLDRTTTVVITALDDGVDFTQRPEGTTEAFTPTVMFGPDVTVAEVKVLNARMVAATITAEKNASVGFRDVKVTTATRPAGNPLLGAQVFEVRSPIRVEAVSGIPEQGGRVELRVTNEDNLPFDPTNLRLFVANDTPFVNLTPLTMGTNPSVATFTALVDPLAPAGRLPVFVANVKTNRVETTYYSDPTSPALAARAPTAVVAGTPLTDETVAVANATRLYSLAPPSASSSGTILDLSVTGTGASANPVSWITSRGGRAAELLGTQTGDLASMILPVDATVGEMFLIVGDAQGRSGDAATIGWSVTSTAINTTAVTESGTAHGVGSPQVLTSSTNEALLVSGAIASLTDDDVYRVDLGTAARLRIGLTRKNPMGTVTISTDPNFNTADVTIAPDDRPTTLNTTVETAATASTWYIRLQPHADWWLTSYALGIVPR